MSPSTEAQKRAQQRYRSKRAELTVTMEKSVKAALVSAAKEENIPTSRLVLRLITEYLERRGRAAAIFYLPPERRMPSLAL